MQINSNLEVLIVKPLKKAFVVGEKLCIPAVTCPTVTLENEVRRMRVESGFAAALAETLFNVNPMPVHIDCSNSNRNISVDEFIH